MARLNEPPIAPGPATETVELVKRRYLRQNRELAKTNSQQSIRIRNLETEGSRLLAENLSLREQILHLQNTIDARSDRPSFDDIDTVKSRLEAKLQEFGSLVAELGHLRKSDSGRRRKSQPTAVRPEERQWRSGLGLQAVENAMLPTIVENKYYPRHTMGADELQEILDEPESQSPDLGPPPVSQFTSEDSIAFNPSPPIHGIGEDPAREPTTALPMNLEKRKKRRDSDPKEARRVSMKFERPDEEMEPEPEPRKKVVRVGAKRKFSVQEDEERLEKPDPQGATFSFTRKNATGGTDNGTAGSDGQDILSARPVLGSKPVNTDPVVSPKKQRSSTSDKPEKKASEKRSSSGKTGRSRITITRTTQPELPPVQLPASDAVAEIHLEPLQPTTPAVESIMSPPITEPSTSRPSGRDTPPPSDLNPDESVPLGGRPSRRARPQVSYKEPPLNIKMRRPGDKLADAVIDRRQSRESTNVAKKEPNSQDAAWNPVPSEPGCGNDEAEAGSPLKEKLGRNLGEPPQDAPRGNSSAASNAISALISATGSRRSTSSTARTAALSAVSGEAETGQATIQPTNVQTQEKDNLAIFDLPDEPQSRRQRVDLAKLAKSSRRHSVLPSMTSSESAKLNASLPSVHQRSGSEADVKNSSGSGSHARSSSSSRASVREKRSSALPSSAGSDADAKTARGRSDTTQLKAERASRRKSMMI